MSHLVDNLNAAIANLGGAIDHAVTTLEAQAEIEYSIARLNQLTEKLKAVLPSVPPPVDAAESSAVPDAAEAVPVAVEAEAALEAVEAEAVPVAVEAEAVPVAVEAEAAPEAVEAEAAPETVEAEAAPEAVEAEAAPEAVEAAADVAEKALGESIDAPSAEPQASETSTVVEPAPY
ncbi:MAG: hypothetical protein FWD68_00725 [Alphaproteobacteria bacterium]|nr:hypothetical protein [Alphaproteobacteria bacterium]